MGFFGLRPSPPPTAIEFKGCRTLEFTKNHARRHKTTEQKDAKYVLQIEVQNSRKRRGRSALTRSRKGVLVYLAIMCVSWSPDTPANLLATDA